jgi:hypothetical protein
MWLQRFTQYMLRHRIQALALTFFITFIPILGMLSILIAALITLLKGIRDGALFTIAATLPFLINFYISNHNITSPIAYWAALIVAISSNVLTWIFAVMLQKKTNWSTLIQIAALFGVLVVSIIHLVYPDITNWWTNQLQSYYEHTASIANVLNTDIVKSHDTQLEVIQITKQYATGLMIAAILFNAILQLMIARWWQNIVFPSIALHKELHIIRLSKLASILFMLSLVFVYLKNSVALDIMPIIYLLFTAAGLSLIHYLFNLMKTRTRWFWMWIFYLILIFTIPISMLVVSMLALIDVWLDMRKQVVKI